MIIIESVNHIGLTVSDLEKSIKFYKDVFDFEVIDKLSTSGIAYLKMTDIIIGLFEEEDFEGDSNSNNRLSFFVDEEDFDDAVEELKELEVNIIHGPENLRNGQSVVFQDLDGKSN